MSCVSLERVAAELSDLLQSHANRDKVLCLASYALKLCGSLACRDALLRAGARVAQARSTTRLLDDAALVKAMLAYGLGRQDGPLWGALGAAYSVFYLGYLQTEKALWARDGRAEPWWTAHKLCWALFSAIGFVRSIRQLHIAAEALQSPTRRRCARARCTLAALTSTKLLLDVVHTVDWLPRGWLWGGRLGGAGGGGVASAAAALALLIHYRARALEGKEK